MQGLVAPLLSMENGEGSRSEDNKTTQKHKAAKNLDKCNHDDTLERDFDLAITKRDWSSIPDQLLEEIMFKRPFDMATHIRLRSLCRHWRTFALSRITDSPIEPIPPTPFLIVPDDSNTIYNNANRIRLISFYDYKLYRLLIPKAPPTYHFGGSSGGWLVLLDNTSPSIFIYNPFTMERIELQSLTTFPDILDFNPSNTGREYRCLTYTNRESSFGIEHVNKHFITKLVLSPNPTSSSFQAMAIFGLCTRKIAFCKSGHDKWTLLQSTDSAALDIIHYRGSFIAYKESIGVSVVVNLDSPALLMKLPIRPHPPPAENDAPNIASGAKKYLVELSGELVLVIKDLKIKSNFGMIKKPCLGYPLYMLATKGFRICRLDLQRQKLVTMKSIGDHALFISHRSVIAIESPRCKGNCIYFSRDLDAIDNGIFNVESNLVEPFPPSCTPYLPSSWLTPIWFTPWLR